MYTPPSGVRQHHGTGRERLMRHLGRASSPKARLFLRASPAGIGCYGASTPIIYLFISARSLCGGKPCRPVILRNRNQAADRNVDLGTEHIPDRALTIPPLATIERQHLVLDEFSDAP